jgi:hypothetical protein
MLAYQSDRNRAVIFNDDTVLPEAGTSDANQPMCIPPYLTRTSIFFCTTSFQFGFQLLESINGVKKYSNLF